MQTYINPEAVKGYIGNGSKWKNSTKISFFDTYQAYLKFKGIEWTRQKIEVKEANLFIPTEAEIDQLINDCQLKMATMLQLLKETGIRISEAPFNFYANRISKPQQNSPSRLFGARLDRGGEKNGRKE